MNNFEGNIEKILAIQILREQGRNIPTQRVEDIEELVCEQVDLERDCITDISKLEIRKIK